jgi:hypothetical protein
MPRVPCEFFEQNGPTHSPGYQGKAEKGPPYIERVSRLLQSSLDMFSVFAMADLTVHALAYSPCPAA